MVNYFKKSFDELKNRVTWSNRSEVSRLVFVVSVFSVVFSLMIWGVDSILEKLVRQYFYLAG